MSISERCLWSLLLFASARPIVLLLPSTHRSNLAQCSAPTSILQVKRPVAAGSNVEARSAAAGTFAQPPACDRAQVPAWVSVC